MKQIAEYYATAARKQGEAGAWQDSLAQSETGLGVLPGHSGLLALRDRAQAALAEVGRHERRRQAVADLLAEAERQLQAGQLMQPEGDNAHASLLKVLALEPENAAAAAGLARIADHYMQEARRQGEAGAWQNSLELSERGLEVVPDHPELLALREQAQAGLTELEARRQEVQRRQQQVLDLLATAERQLKAGRLTVPETDNAHATYLQVLKLDPDNEEAQTGLKWMAERYAQWAWERGEAGEWQESLDQIERGLQVNPGHAGLLALQQQARLALEAAERERQEAEKRRQQVAELLALAAQQMDLNRLTEPSEANAHETYREVLNLNPDNPEAKRGLAEIVQRYTQWAQEQREAGAWQETLDLSDRGLRVAPDDDELLALREQARKALAEAEKRRREVAALLAEARRQLRAGQLAEPEGDNAHATYRKVLKLEPENSEAKQELIEIAERYADWAQEQAEAGAWEKSLAHSERGLTVSPGYPRLMALRDRAQTALAEAERKRQEAERRHRRVVDLLAVAQQQLQAGRLTEPEGDNALSSFTEVLALESDNREAQAGLVQIAKLIAGQARDLAEAGQWRESLARSEQGLKAFPDNGELMAQRQQAQAALDEAERRHQESLRRQQEVAKLLASARQQLALGHLVEPVNENAHASYLRVLELDPGNREAEGESRKSQRYLPARRRRKPRPAPGGKA
ncbi:hypothetical protein [Marinobacterium aestuariivivens]|uniref:Tetratricopeptide repeat protein n=1 Tax=Marinobacterium aestuariivivens TaxID=1698799 RepID=A0ABW1ZY37_9GAMM